MRRSVFPVARQAESENRRHGIYPGVDPRFELSRALAGLVAIDIASHRLDVHVPRRQHARERRSKRCSPYCWQQCVHARRGDHKKGREVLKRALELDPANPERTGLLGQLYVTAGGSEATKTSPMWRGSSRIRQRLPSSSDCWPYAKRDLRRRSTGGSALTIDPSPPRREHMAWLYAKTTRTWTAALELAGQTVRVP